MPSQSRLVTAVETLKVYAEALWLLGQLVHPTAVRAPRKARTLLYLSRNLPPHFHGGVFRQVAFLKAAVKAGWEVEVITDTPPSQPTLAGREMLRELPSVVRLHRWEPSTRSPSYRWSTDVSGGFSSIRRIIRAAERIEVPPSLVAASGPPFAEFMAAPVIARGFSAACVLDYRDEWTTNPLEFVQRGNGDRLWEHLALRRAHACVCATESMRQHLASAFSGMPRARSVTIRNGWDSSDAFSSSRERTEDLRPTPTTIGFFGWLAEHWGFDEFVNVLKQALDLAPRLRDELEFVIYGGISPPIRRLLETLPSTPRFALQGLVPRSIAHRAMTGCGTLLLLTSPRLARVLPGKIYDYLASRRPILLYGTEGEMASLLAGWPGATIVPRCDPEALATALTRIASGIPDAELAAAPLDLRDSYSRSRRDTEWVEYLESWIHRAEQSA